MYFKMSDFKNVRRQILVNGYRFVIGSQSKSTYYLKCAQFRNRCRARATKRKDSNRVFVTYSIHNHNAGS